MVTLETNLHLTKGQASDLLSAWLGTGVTCTEMTPLEGGMLNTVLRLMFDRAPHTAVIKLNGEGKTFNTESRALRHMWARDFCCPEVYLDGVAGGVCPYAFLLLETLPGVHMGRAGLDDKDRDRVERELAEALVQLHTHTRERFGAVDEQGVLDWRAAFMPALREVRVSQEVTSRLPAAALDRVDLAIEVGDTLLADHGVPTLIHGDIWEANVMVVNDDDGWHLSGLIDPSAQYGDVEMELAYLRSFHAPWTAFFDTYTALRPMRKGYELRWLVYWLRTYLVHVYYFEDAHYREAVGWAADEILSRA